MQRHPYVCEPRDLYLAECSECEILEQNIEDVEEKLDTCCREVKATLSDHENRITANRTDINKLRTDLDTCCKEVKDTLSDHEGRIAKNTSDIATNKSNIAKNTTDIKTNADGIAGIRNDLKNYYTKSETYTQTEVNNLINAIEKVVIRRVQSLPATGESNIIYLVPKSGTDPDVHDEYVWANGKFEKIGDTKVDLSNYVTIPQMNTELAKKQNNLSAGSNIQINGNTISATDTTYTATAPISISGTTISHNNSGVTAGSKGDTANQTPAFGGTFKVTSETVDAKGHTTALAEHTVKIPDTEATTTAKGLMSAGDKTKLNGIATGAEVNQNAFSNVKVGSTTVAADNKTDTLELVGSNVTLTPDATNDKVTIGITKANVVAALGYTPPTQDTTYSNATQSAAGLMSPDDKKKLDNLINTIHPVGDTIIRLDETNPGTLYPGTTWEKVSVGRMLIGANSTYTLGSTGGSADAVVVSHNHTQNSHNHTQASHSHTQAAHSHGTVNGAVFLVTEPTSDISVNHVDRLAPTSTASNAVWYVYGSKNSNIAEHANTASATPDIYASTATNNAATATNNATGVDGTGKNMPPYLAVNIWRRTA